MIGAAGWCPAGNLRRRFRVIPRQALGRKIVHKEVGHSVESAVEARAGYLDRPVLVVLCVSTIVAALVLAGVWIGITMMGSGAV